MKTFLFFFSALFLSGILTAQSEKTGILENLEKGQGRPEQSSQNQQSQVQQNLQTAVLKTSARLFAAKDDLTTVITIIPSGSRVAVMDSDSSYYRVVFEESEGYILKKQAVLDDKPVIAAAPETQEEPVQGARPVEQPTISRFTYLENKYGTNVAARINSGKIWKGMNGEMVRDSWGNPEKINRVISSNTVKEDWTYKSTMLYFENNRLVNWGPRK